MNQNGMMLLHAMNGVRAAYIQEATISGVLWQYCYLTKAYP